LNNNNNNNNNNNKDIYFEKVSELLLKKNSLKSTLTKYFKIEKQFNMKKEIEEDLYEISSLNFMRIKNKDKLIKYYRPKSIVLSFFLQNDIFIKKHVKETLCNLHFQFCMSRAVILNPNVYSSSILKDVHSVCFESILTTSERLDTGTIYSFTTLLKMNIDTLLSRDLFQRGLTIRLPEPIFYMNLSLRKQIRTENKIYSTNDKFIVDLFNNNVVGNLKRTIVCFFEKKKSNVKKCIFYDTIRGEKKVFLYTKLTDSIVSLIYDEENKREYSLKIFEIEEPEKEIEDFRTKTIDFIKENNLEFNYEDPINESYEITNEFLTYLSVLKQEKPIVWDRYSKIIFYVIDSLWDLNLIINSSLFTEEEKNFFIKNPHFDMKNNEIGQILKWDEMKVYRGSESLKKELRKIIQKHKQGEQNV
jgi:hypothetical protein